jgi:hypothetical protein
MSQFQVCSELRQLLLDLVPSTAVQGSVDSVIKVSTFMDSACKGDVNLLQHCAHTWASVLRSPPQNLKERGSNPGPGANHMQVLQLLYVCNELVVYSPCSQGWRQSFEPELPLAVQAGVLRLRDELSEEELNTVSESDTLITEVPVEKVGFLQLNKKYLLLTLPC